MLATQHSSEDAPVVKYDLSTPVVGSPVNGEVEQSVTDHMPSKVNTTQPDLQKLEKVAIKTDIEKIEERF